MELSEKVNSYLKKIADDANAVKKKSSGITRLLRGLAPIKTQPMSEFRAKEKNFINEFGADLISTGSALPYKIISGIDIRFEVGRRATVVGTYPTTYNPDEPILSYMFSEPAAMYAEYAVLMYHNDRFHESPEYQNFIRSYGKESSDNNEVSQEEYNKARAELRKQTDKAVSVEYKRCKKTDRYTQEFTPSAILSETAAAAEYVDGVVNGINSALLRRSREIFNMNKIALNQESGGNDGSNGNDISFSQKVQVQERPSVSIRR